MVSRQGLRQGWTIGLLLTWMVLLAPSLAVANANLPSDLVQKARERARDLENQGKWEEALTLYDALLLKDRSLTEVKDLYRQCLRRLHLVNRHRDPTFRQQVLKLPAGEAIKLYEIVLTHLQKNYVDRDKVQPARLFQEGLRELQLALSDPVFVQTHLSSAHADAIRAFEAVLRERWGRETPADPARAAALVREVSVAARKALGLKATLVTIEFVCGACNSLDEYTVYLTPSQLADEDTSLESEFVGIGIHVELKDQKLIITAVAPNSPAAQAGLKENDQIIRIDQRLTGKLSSEAARQLLRGEAGSLVEIEVVSPGDRTPRSPYKLIRQPSVVWTRLFEQETGYIRIVGFQKTTMRELEEAVEQLRKMGMKALVLDLRGNQGGLFEVAVQVAERFLSSGRIVSTQGRIAEFHNRDYLVPAGHPYLDLPLVVLVDGETASAAEVVAGALKENTRQGQPRATLVGQPTFGKGSIQRVLELKMKLDELKTVPVGIRMTLARLFSPLNQPYNGCGITPHILVERISLSLVPDRSMDRQLDMALNEAVRLFMLRQ